MKISKIYEELKDVVLNKKNGEKKKAELESEIAKKISKTKQELSEAKSEKEIENLKGKLAILERLNKLTSAE
jgi:hypothetical protein